MENNQEFAFMITPDYVDIHKLQTDEEYKKEMYSNVKLGVMKQIIRNTNDGKDMDKAYRIEVKLLDGMNFVAKATEVPIEHVIIKIPEFATDFSKYRKYNLKERLKILFKGEL